MAANLQKITAKFLHEQATSRSLITVTDFRLSSDGRHATALISVLPSEAETSALDFANRRRQELRKYVQDHLRIGFVPTIQFAIDEGEKHRQKIDKLLQ